MNGKILIVDDEESIRFTFNMFLSDAGYLVDTAENLETALEKVGSQTYDAVFLDILLGRDSGMSVLRAGREKQPNTSVIMVTGAPEIKSAAEAVRLGAFDYIAKPIHQDELLRQARLGVERKVLLDQQEVYRLRMSAVFQSVCEGILVFDEEMKLLEVNGAAEKMLDCACPILGLSPLELSAVCPPLELLQSILDARCEGEIFHVETVNGTGQPLVFSMTMAPLTGHGQCELGTVVVLRQEARSVEPMNF